MRDRLIRPFFEAGSGSGDGEGGGTGSTGQESGSGAPGGQQGGSGSGSDQDQMVPASELSRTRNEAAKYRNERNELAKRIEELEKGQMSEKEKAEKERDDAMKTASARTQENRELRARLLAGDVGIVAQARLDAARLLDWDSIEDPSDDKQVVKALKELTKDRPYLLGTSGGADGGAGSGNQPGSGGMNQLIRKAAGRA